MVRLLTAIMFTDMAGFTALMQRDEERAAADRDRQRNVLDRAIPQHGGRVLQYYGDGTLSVFSSALEAVLCAVEIQQELGREGGVPLRIGIHSGDIVHDDHGVFGDGVNVASRIQSLSVPGGVLISGKVFDEVKNHAGVRTRSLGAFKLKHVEHPTRVFAVTNEGLSIPSDATLAASRPLNQRSVAVLPFMNMSGNEDNDFFSDGITEEIINALTRVNGLKVTARTSSFAFKNKHVDVRDIAQELGVTHVLEGSVRRAGGRVRVTAQLICAQDGYHLFSQNYDRSLDDIFSVQDEISRTIVHELADHLGPVRTSEYPRSLMGGHSHDSEAHAEYLRGRYDWAKTTPEAARRAIEHFQTSIAMDPHCALPYTGLASAYVFLGAIGQAPADVAFPEAEAAALRALELEPDLGESHVALGTVQLFYHWDFDAAYRSFQKAISITPGSAEVRYLYSLYLQAIGDEDEGLAQAREAVQLDPLSPAYRNSLARFLAIAGLTDLAMVQARRALAIDPAFRSAVESEGWIHVIDGDLARAAAAFDRLPVMSGAPWSGAGPRGYAYARLGRMDEVESMLELLRTREASQPGVTLDLDYALVYEGLGDRDKALALIESAVEKRMGGVVLVHTFWTWRDTRYDPRFQSILLEKIGLPAAILPQEARNGLVPEAVSA